MKTIVVLAKTKGKPVCGKDGKRISRNLQVPETRAEIDKAFGSMRNMMILALKQRKIMLQAEIRAEANAGTTAQAGATLIPLDF